MNTCLFSYPDILERIFHLPKSAAGERSLSNMTRLCSYLGEPQKAFSVIHVAGTNGKGSVCTKIASALQAQGYRTGLYTSPHISSFCERIQIDGILIPEDDVCRLYPQVLKAIEACGISAGFFEIATLLAFLYFREQQIEIAVIETGLGGIYDATNIVSPLLSIITSIGFDHQEILGRTLQEICHAKAGILKQNTPAVLGPTVPIAWVQPIAEKKRCRLFQSTLKSKSYDRENQEIARVALQTISERFPVESSALEVGLQKSPPCRFERHQIRGKELILDVAHNPQGFERLLELLRHRYPGAAYRFVCGFSRGKDIGECAELIQKNASAVHLVSGSHPRLAAVGEIAPYFDPKKTFLENSIQESIQNTLATHCHEIVVITGSFFIMDEARSNLPL